MAQVVKGRCYVLQDLYTYMVFEMVDSLRTWEDRIEFVLSFRVICHGIVL